jgi:hypothetical protein
MNQKLVRAIMQDICDMADPDNPFQSSAELKRFCESIETYLIELRTIANGGEPEWAGGLLA